MPAVVSQPPSHDPALKRLVIGGLIGLPILIGLAGGFGGRPALSEDERRAAEAHADNLCALGRYGMSDLASRLGDAGDIARMDARTNRDARYVAAGTDMARDRGCID